MIQSFQSVTHMCVKPSLGVIKLVVSYGSISGILPILPYITNLSLVRKRTFPVVFVDDNNYFSVIGCSIFGGNNDYKIS